MRSRLITIKLSTWNAFLNFNSVNLSFSNVLGREQSILVRCAVILRYLSLGWVLKIECFDYFGNFSL